MQNHKQLRSFNVTPAITKIGCCMSIYGRLYAELRGTTFLVQITLKPQASFALNSRSCRELRAEVDRNVKRKKNNREKTSIPYYAAIWQEVMSHRQRKKKGKRKRSKTNRN